MEREKSHFKAISISALENLKCAVLITKASNSDNSDNPVIYANPAFEALTGFSQCQLLGRDCRFLQNDDRNQPALADIRKAIQKQVPVSAVLRNYHKDGTLFYNEIFINPIRNKAGEVTHFVSCQNEIASPKDVYLRKEAARLVENLSPREKQVFYKVVHGYTNKEIAQILELSPRTVEKHRLRMHKKMATHNLSLLIRYAIALGYEFNECR